jgi:hypothetical protein
MIPYPMFSSESSQSPSPSSVFSHLCELCVSAFGSLAFGFHPERSDQRLRPCRKGPASLCPGASFRNARNAAPLRPNPFPSFPQRVNIQHAATPATPFLSCVYFTILWTPGVGGTCIPTGSRPAATAFTPPLFSCSYALFCTTQSTIPCPFNAFRTLSPKHRGWGGGGTDLNLCASWFSPLTTHYSLFAHRKQTRLSRRGIGNGFQLGILRAQRFGHFHFGAFQDADQLEGVDDTLALVVVVGDDENFA